MRSAIAASVDGIEIDLWYACGRLVARHERGVWCLPVLYDKWHIRFVRGGLVDLDELLCATEGGPYLFLDLKGMHRKLPGAIAQALRRHNALSRAAVCGQYWPPLDAIGREAPEIRIYHSLGRPEHVSAYIQRSGQSGISTGVSIAHWLLTPNLVTRLKDSGREVFVWTVNDSEQASRFVSWGVNGVISDRLDLLAGLP